MSPESLGKHLRGEEEPWWPHIRRLVILWGTQLVNQRPRKGANYFSAEALTPDDLPEDPFQYKWVIEAVQIGIAGRHELTSVLIKKHSDETAIISVVA